MEKKVRWGVLGAAKIGLKKVLPAMAQSRYCEIAGIASRDLRKAQAAGFGRAYGSYAELLQDPSIEAVYNPLPNHLHVEWTRKAAEAGKHVLCEKPIALAAAGVRELIEVRNRTGVKIGEAFMSRVHPQWLRARELVQAGAIGELRSMTTVFSYFNVDAANIRNVREYGGGALLDIGCYPITMSRFLFASEPLRVAAKLERDARSGVDRLTSGLLEFASGHSIFTVSTQMSPYQRVTIFGTTGSIEIEIPFNAPPNEITRILVNGSVEEIPACDQYTIQGDLFAKAVRGEGEVPVTLEDSLANMRVIDAVFASERVAA